MKDLMGMEKFQGAQRLNNKFFDLFGSGVGNGLCYRGSINKFFGEVMLFKLAIKTKVPDPCDMGVLELL